MYLRKKSIKNYWVCSGTFHTQTADILWQKRRTFHVTKYLLFFVLKPATFTWYPRLLVMKQSSLSLHSLLLILQRSIKSFPLPLFHNSPRLPSPSLPFYIFINPCHLLCISSTFTMPFLQCRRGTMIPAHHIQGPNWAHVYTVTEYFLLFSY